ncbi:MAG TPA: Mur ligase domain-containing protein, partial [Candidatus Paceibacterota bacterium]|nr:Mur ligase domain-containing protein [Candidatus Paceibacterota bacterium]
MDLKNAKKVHFVGIGGIGISAIARMMLEEGKEVSGSDGSSSVITQSLAELGIKIYQGHQADNLSAETDLVIYTIAIPGDNPELAAARERGIPMLTYPETLGLISADKRTIAIAGTHGKTTTTAMLAQIAVEAKRDPTVIVGSILKGQHSNFIAGASDLLIVEACEYRRSFLNINPTVVVITNIDNDHLDYYKDFADIQEAFKELVRKIPEHGALICNVNDPALEPIVKAAHCQVIDYVAAERAVLQVPGEHNQQNAQAALAAAQFLGIEKQEALAALGRFAGTWRRFEYKGKTSVGALVYTDYGHHPTEVRAALAAAREVVAKTGKGRVLVAFQPHLYSRTKLLFDDFAASFSDVDKVWLADIYGAREEVD